MPRAEQGRFSLDFENPYLQRTDSSGIVNLSDSMAEVNAEGVLVPYQNPPLRILAEVSYHG